MWRGEEACVFVCVCVGVCWPLVTKRILFGLFSVWRGVWMKGMCVALGLGGGEKHLFLVDLNNRPGLLSSCFSV